MRGSVGGGNDMKTGCTKVIYCSTFSNSQSDITTNLTRNIKFDFPNVYHVLHPYHTPMKRLGVYNSIDQVSRKYLIICPMGGKKKGFELLALRDKRTVHIASELFFNYSAENLNGLRQSSWCFWVPPPACILCDREWRKKNGGLAKKWRRCHEIKSFLCCTLMTMVASLIDRIQHTY